MRDPEGTLEFDGSTACRRLHKALDAGHFLRRPEAARMVTDGLLTPYAIADDRRIDVRRLPFVSYPYEWIDSQLWSAAELTLEVLRRAAEAGWELKDATGFNVIFRGTRPEFCDHLSFAPIARREWWAYGQFIRHFIAPLAISRQSGLPAARTHRGGLDGLAVDAARRMLGPRRWFHRSGFALIEHRTGVHRGRMNHRPGGSPLHAGLHRFLCWQLDGLVPKSRQTAWSDYESDRIHYSPSSLAEKRSTVTRWLDTIRPQRVLDLGCNQGEFSALALAHATQVICVDADSASLEALWHRFKDDERVHPVLASLDDPSEARGWRGREFTSLVDRLRAQAGTTLALAVVHHLAIGRSIPLDDIADLMADCTEEHLIIELVGTEDPKVGELLAGRNRTDAETFSLDRQRMAFLRRFSIIETVNLPDTQRQLLLMRKARHAQ